MTIRVLVVEAAGNLWGSERALLDLLPTMSSIEMAVCTPPGRPLNQELERRQIRVFQYYIYQLDRKSKWHRIRAAIGVLRACLEFRPDVVYLNQSGSYKVTLAAAALLRLPIVAHVRIFEDAAYLAQLHRASLSYLRAIIAISSAVEAEVRRFERLKKISLYRIYDSYRPTARGSSPSPTKRIGNRIACVGRLVPVKGQDVLIRALYALAKLDDSIECFMLGDGDQNFVRALKRLACECGVKSRIRWLGFVTDIVPILQTCSVLVCPSHREPLGRVIFEAWDAGVVPVACSGSAGAAEVISAADGGILYAEQTPEILAQALHDALRLPQKEITRLTTNGRSWMRSQCDPSIYGETITGILKAAAD